MEAGEEVEVGVGVVWGRRTKWTEVVVVVAVFVVVLVLVVVVSMRNRR